MLDFLLAHPWLFLAIAVCGPVCGLLAFIWLFTSEKKLEDEIRDALESNSADLRKRNTACKIRRIVWKPSQETTTLRRPIPGSRKYTLSRMITAGSAEFWTDNGRFSLYSICCLGIPLETDLFLHRLFETPGIRQAWVGQDHITIEISRAYVWAEIEPVVYALLCEFYFAGQEVAMRELGEGSGV